MTYTPEQQAENREKWAKALENGEYVQGRASLCSSGKYCCLGVGCLVVGIDPSPNTEDFYQAVQEAMGIKDTMDFWTMNDADNLPFPQIAHAIRTRKELFV